MAETLTLPQTLADQLLSLANAARQPHGVGRVYRNGAGSGERNYFIAEPGSPRNVETTDELFALFTVHDDAIDSPDETIISTIRKPTILLTISPGTKGRPRIRAWQCNKGTVESYELEIVET